MAQPAVVKDLAELYAGAASDGNRGAFTLYHADTHGTESPIFENISEDFAKTALEFFERRTHHQGYWYRRADPPQTQHP